MKKTARNRVVQASAVLRQVAENLTAGATMADAIRQASISEKVFRQWRAEYACFELDQIERIKEMEVENSRLRRTAHDLSQQVMGLASTDGRQPCERTPVVDRLEIAEGLVSIDHSDAGMGAGRTMGRSVPQDLVKHLESLRIENHRLRQSVANLTLRRLIRGMAPQG